LRKDEGPCCEEDAHQVGEEALMGWVPVFELPFVRLDFMSVFVEALCGADFEGKRYFILFSKQALRQRWKYIVNIYYTIYKL
jgi:hypothetical protein